MKTVLISALAIFLGAANAATAAGLEGTWMFGDTHVRLAPCGSAMCGKIVWLRKPLDAAGRPRSDTLNPDVSKRNRPMLGLQVAALRSDKSGTWRGTVYNADDGRSFKASLKLDSERQATLTGCLLGVICKNVAWSRVD